MINCSILKKISRQDESGKTFVLLVTFLFIFGFCSCSLATPRDQAKRIHDRLVGIPPSETVLDNMTNEIVAGNVIAAANIAMENSVFFNVTLKNFVTPWTNAEQTAFAPLNDYTATVIGMIRDNKPFKDVLSADIVYVGVDTLGLTPYSQTDNDHYIDLENNRIDLSDPANFEERTQSRLPDLPLPATATAGVLTTRAAGEAFLKAGTNRRMWRFIGINYLCRDMEQLSDVTRTPDRIRQDVSRSPGGDSSVFLNSCIGCHSGMDPMTQAFAYFNFQVIDVDAGLERVVYVAGEVQPKNTQLSTNFSLGYITTSDRWDNYWRSGANAILQWRGPSAGGNGPKSLGVEVASSRAFSECQVKKVFEQVCFRPPTSSADNDEVERIADVFEAQNYNMKRVFAETADYCKGV